MELTGRSTVVTGGASGIGAATAQALRAAGATVVAWDLEADGEDVIRCDVTQPADVDRALAETVARNGVPTVLVANAGIGGFAGITDIELDGFRHVLDVNLVGPLRCIQAVVRALDGAGTQESVTDAAIVCVTSVNARIADRGMAAYCCSKAALDMLVRVAAAELGSRGIRVNAVAPGVTDTPLFSQSAGRIPGFVDGVIDRTPLGRLGTPGDIADAVLAVLAADWLTGQSLVVDGGLSLHSPIDPVGALQRNP